MEPETSFRIKNRAMNDPSHDSAHPSLFNLAYFRMPNAAMTAWYFPSSRRRK